MGLWYQRAAGRRRSLAACPHEEARKHMALLDIDTLSEDEKAVQETVRKFAREVMRPVGQKLDKMTAEQVVAQDSPFWEVQRQFRELGLDDTAGMNPLEAARMRFLAYEELGWGDAGLAISFSSISFPEMAAGFTGNPAVMERFKGTFGCWAITEPDHGTNMLDYAGKLSVKGSEQRPPNCIAVKDGNEYVINGQKAAWVSNGAIANAAVLFCATDHGGKRGHGVFVVRLDEKGVSKGKPLDKIGQRALPQGEIFFDNVRIPATHAIGNPDSYPLFSEIVLAHANAGSMGTIFVGLARSALELAIDYAKERVQSGVPIIQHQNIKLKLFEMFRKVEAARSLNRRVLTYFATSGQTTLQYAISSKVTSTQTAFEVASEALQVFGGNGTSREYPIEKIFRDARSSMIEDGCNEVLALIAADKF
jgi:alkylation response protein AidB-like acyl-CoA dehydrogenase